MKLEVTHKTSQVLSVYCLLNSHGEKLKAGEIAERLGVTRQMVPKLLEPLVRGGWVSSNPGPTGGYKLAEGAPQVSVLDLIEAVEGPTINGQCAMKGGPCDEEKPCALHVAWVPARDSLIAILGLTMLDEMCATGACSTP